MQIKSEETRDRIIEAAVTEMSKTGYQSTSMNSIIDTLGLSKGAVYHHFPSKLTLGYAVIDERLNQQDIDMWDKPLSHPNPVTGIQSLLMEISRNLTGESLSCGCPINNLAYEMSPIDEGFRLRIVHIYNRRRRKISEALQRAQLNNQFSSTANTEETASFIIATLHGAMGLAKNANCNAIYNQAIKGLIEYLTFLRHDIQR